MPTPAEPPAPERWAHLRFSIVGPLLAAPPHPGELRAEIERLAVKSWLHPVTREAVRFGASTIERWYYAALRQRVDPVGSLRRAPRKDRGRQTAISAALAAAVLTQYGDHRSWSCQLHWDNLRVRVQADPALGSMPSYSTLRRFLQARGLVRRPRRARPHTEGALRAEARLEAREVRSYEAEHVHALWHYDFHHGSRPVLGGDGAWATPILFGVLDDRSRLGCHAQWYLAEDAETLVHGLCQAFQKRGLPRATLSDNGPAMVASETCAGLLRLGITQDFTLPYSPYQNAKQEVFWAQVEGRLLAMLDNVPDLTLALLNEATQAWLELEYNRKVHTELGVAPLERALAGPTLVRPCPGSDDLRRAFTTQEVRIQRQSDGTLSLAGRRFEVPSRYRHLRRLTVRYARWDLATVYLADDATGTLLDRIYPLDKTKNADGRRRTLAPGPADGLAHAAAREPAGAVAPLLAKLMADYAATGLPPAYLPKAGHPSSDLEGAPERAPDHRP